MDKYKEEFEDIKNIESSNLDYAKEVLKIIILPINNPIKNFFIFLTPMYKFSNIFYSIIGHISMVRIWKSNI